MHAITIILPYAARSWRLPTWTGSLSSEWKFLIDYGYRDSHPETIENATPNYISTNFTDFIIIIKKQREIGTLKMVKKKKPSKFLSILEEEEF